MANSADDYEEVNEGARGRVSVKSADRVLTLFELLGRWVANVPYGNRRSYGHSQEQLEPVAEKSRRARLAWLLVRHAEICAWAGHPRFGARRRASPGRRRALRSGAHRACAATNETAALNILRGDLAETVATALGSETLLAVMRLGQRAPLYTTSYGKVLLAYLPEEMQEDYLGRVKLAAVTPKSIVSRSSCACSCKLFVATASLIPSKSKSRELSGLHGRFRADRQCGRRRQYRQRRDPLRQRIANTNFRGDSGGDEEAVATASLP